jgi:hypothetical protein
VKQIMDSNKPPQKSAQLLSDLENIRTLLGSERPELPLLTDSIEPQAIPMLSEVVAAGDRLQPASPPGKDKEAELKQLEAELKGSAHLLLQDVVDDFVPQIEAELKRRLELHLNLLLARRKR